MLSYIHTTDDEGMLGQANLWSGAVLDFVFCRRYNRNAWLHLIYSQTLIQTLRHARSHPRAHVSSFALSRYAPGLGTVWNLARASESSDLSRSLYFATIITAIKYTTVKAKNCACLLSSKSRYTTARSRFTSISWSSFSGSVTVVMWPGMFWTRSWDKQAESLSSWGAPDLICYCLARIVRKVDNDIHRLNHHEVDSAAYCVKTCPVGSDLCRA